MINTKAYLLAAAVAPFCFATNARAETPEEWVTLGARVHGAFGSFIPVGIRIGLDALKRLDAQPRGVTVVYYSGTTAPCPCPVDGIALATMASPGQGTLQVAPEKAPEGLMGVAVIRSKANGAGRQILDCRIVDRQAYRHQQNPRPNRPLRCCDERAGFVHRRTAAGGAEAELAARLKFGLRPHAKHRRWAAIAVIGGVDDELVIERHVPGIDRQLIIGLDDLFQARMRQLSVADLKTQAAGVEKSLVRGRDAVDHAGQSEGIVGPTPLRAFQRQASRHGAIDVGIGVGLDIAAGKARAGKQAEIGGDFLLEIDAQAGAAAVLPDRGDIGRATGDLGQRDGVLVGAEPAAGDKTGERDLAGMAP